MTQQGTGLDDETLIPNRHTTQSSPKVLCAATLAARDGKVVKQANVEAWDG